VATGRTANATRRITGESDYYALLGVPYSATVHEINRAYREAMKRVHPDRQQPEARAAAEERAKELNRAFTTLSRAESRRAYDAEIKIAVVQDEIMNRYVGGFAPTDGAYGASDPFAESIRRSVSRAELNDQRRADRSATFNLLFVFTVVAGFVVLLLVLSSIIGFMLEKLV
jgi:DnaJ-class molecular chaperone